MTDPVQTHYQVVVRRDGPAWRLRVMVFGQPAEAVAEDLAEAERTALDLVSLCCGLDRKEIDIDLDVRLPAAVYRQLAKAEQLAEEAAMEVEAAIVDLMSLGVSVLDIGRILRRRGQSAPSPLTITNQEIVEHGLGRHPRVFGIRSVVADRTVEICRNCVEQTRIDYFDLDPADEHVLLDKKVRHCHRCNPRKPRRPRGPGKPRKLRLRLRRQRRRRLLAMSGQPE